MPRQKPIQNPYGHGKTGHFNALQDTIRNERENTVSVVLQGERDNKLHQKTTGKNKPFGFGKDEVPGSNLGSSSTKSSESASFSDFYLIFQRFSRGNECKRQN